jgi:predicted dehydrogenase
VSVARTSHLDELRAAVVGTGFIGAVHVDALRRLGVEVTGVVGSTPQRAAAKRLAPVYESYEALLDDPRVDVVHLTTPNHLHHAQAKAALEAGKHVVCEKPLTLTAAQSRELVELAERTGLVHCTNFNIRFYPLVQEVRARVGAGDLGDVWNVHGAYLQDWLLLPTDWSWRLDPEQGGALRAVADIGSHWLDLAQFVTGLEIEQVFADLATTIPVRRRPIGAVETFASAEEVEREDAPMSTEDVAHILVRFRGGARGSCVVSQVSAGRKNDVRLEVDGSLGATAWEGERPEELWLGSRDAPNGLLLRNPGLILPAAATATLLPAGHAEGFADTFRELYRAVYRAVAAGTPANDYPTFLDGLRADVLVEAVAASSRVGRWMEVTL